MTNISFRVLAAALSVSLTSLVFAQQVVVPYDNGNVKERYNVVENKREGLYESFYDKGEKYVVANYVKGLMEGEYREFHRNGAPKLVVAVKEGQVTGTFTEYYDNGNVNQQGETYGCRYGANMVNSPMRTGVWVKNHPNGKKSSEGAFEKDFMSGPWKEWYDTGTIQLETTMKEGQVSGTWTQYHENGQIFKQGQTYGNRYHANFMGAPLQTGVWTLYHANGKKKEECNFVKDYRDGLYREWYSTGVPAYEVMFEEGRTVGVWKQFDEEGKVAIQGEAGGNKYHSNTPYSPLKTGVWVSFKNGKVTKAELFEKGIFIRELSYGTDPETGVTKISYQNADGTREVMEVDENGIRTPAAANNRPPEAGDQADLIAMSENPATGEVNTTRRNADGTTSAYRGTTSTDADGSTRVIETDEDGNRVTTVYGNDGTMTVTHSRPGENEVTTTTTKDGVVTTVERKPTGETKTSSVAEDGSVVHQIRDREGNLLRTVKETPDGWLEKTDQHGNTERMLREKDGQTTTVSMDRSGNTTTTVRNNAGEVVEQSSNIVAPLEPGRAYFEQVLKGNDWDDLPASLKNRYAASERMADENRARQALREEQAARDAEEKLRNQLANAAITAEGQRKLDAIEKERVEAERVAKIEAAKVARKREIADSYATTKSLQGQYDAAIARGDKNEAQRIMALQDAHHERSIELLEATPEEAAEMQRAAELQSRVAQEVTTAAYNAANATIASDASLQDTKEDVTGVTKYVSIGSQMQQETKRTTRGANRERTLAEAKIAAIDARLADPKTTAEEKEILQGLRETAEVQSSGATEMLAANDRLTTAGYVVDGALVLTGGKLVQGGARVAQAAVGAARSTLARRAATGIAGRTTVNLSAEAGGTVALSSRMSAAELAAAQEGRTVVDLARVAGNRAGTAAPRLTTEITRAELARLHMPGANLTGAEIMVKAEVYRVHVATRAALRRAIEAGADDAVVQPLQSQYRRLTQMLREAQEAGKRAASGG